MSDQDRDLTGGGVRAPIACRCGDEQSHLACWLPCLQSIPRRQNTPFLPHVKANRPLRFPRHIRVSCKNTTSRITSISRMATSSAFPPTLVPKSTLIDIDLDLACHTHVDK